MNNILAGTPQYPTSANQIYPDQLLTTQQLHYPYPVTSCNVCNMIPLPEWAYGSCQRCEAETVPQRYYAGGRAVGEYPFVNTNEIVAVPGHYVTNEQLYQVNQCDIRQLPSERGAAWQSYNISSTCGPFRN